MTENVERTEVIDLMSETREITEVINEIQGGTKQIHGAVGREAKVMNHLRRKTEGRVMRGLAETEVAELKTEMIENMLKIVVTMTKLIGTGVSGMRKREGRRTGRKEKKQKSSRRGEGRRKED